MLKIFTLAAAVAILPLSEKFSMPGITHGGLSETSSYIFPYKNNITSPFLEPEKKSKETWDQNWITTAQENIRKSEYNFKWEEKLKAYCTPNRKNNFRFFYNDKGFSVEPRTTQIPMGEFDPMARPDEIKYRSIPNWKINFILDKNQVGKGLWMVNENNAHYITDKITVQYINNDEGMRQNFIVHEPLSKNGNLKINFSVRTKLKNKLFQNQLQFFHKKNNVVNYKDLKVWDANGRLLEASFNKNKENRFYIQVDTKNALYPITIDPVSTTPAAIAESNQVNANLGFSVACAGDVNGDGYSDVIAGAVNYDGGLIDEGAAFIYHGSAIGINTTPAAIVESNLVGARLGISVSTAGDVNGDGFSDVVVGANNYSNAETWEGAAYIYHGSSTGINTTAAIIMESSQAQAQMGFSVACAGDVNGDGFSDVIVGVWLFDNPEINEGVAYVYHGSPTGISGTIATTVEANQAASNFGIAVAGAGDVNGDGYSDVVVGAEDYDSGQTDEGVVFVYHGSAAGINNTAAVSMEGNLALSQFGFSVSSAGDINGDGYSDVIVGAYLFSNGESNEGVAFIYQGSAAGISNAAAATLECNQIAASFGVSVACAGDVNGDGYSDVVVGATLYDNGQTNEGAAFVFLGSGIGMNVVAAAVLENNQATSNMGRGVASAGDVNGDGYSDVIAGASTYDNGESNEGAAFVYHGSASGINTTYTTMAECNQVNATFGVSVAGAGDVNADGYSDVIIGAYGYDNGEADEGVAFIFHGSPSGISITPAAMVEPNQVLSNFGYAVSGAGDVNGDGYSDVIVGAYRFDNGQADEGRAFVYHGSATGISTTAATIVESNQTNAYLGIGVSGAGDVNGDGYSDVIVGAGAYDSGQPDEGAAFVFHGSPSGISTIYASRLESNQSFSGFGSTVAGVGDVNGDGYADVVVGAYGYDNGETDEGGAFIFHGSSAGVSTTMAALLESNQVNANLGISGLGCGDFNGDGYSDVIAGVYNFDNGETNEGAAFIYHGSPAGISTTAAVILEPNQAGAAFGFGVSGAGDVNGDGYSDVIVGAYSFDNGETNEGVAFIYNGSPTGINPIAATMVESNRAFSVFGYTVTSAGDVNGDGYSDVIVGAYNFNNGETGEGAAFIYHGNSPGINKRNNLLLYNTDLSTPISSSNFLLANFGAGLYAKSFLGRDSGKIVWETRLNYNAYSGVPITNSTFFTSQQTTYTDMGLAGIELKDLITKLLGGKYTKLRARVKYNPLKAITGQVYSPWRNVSNIIDANHLGVLPIELTSFSAAWLQKGKTAKLDFKTDKESGICCFDIEKSADGFNFYPIGTLTAKNISGIQSYSFIDANATGKNQFYRIKIKGIAGQIDYSNMQQLQNDKVVEILVFPNPTTNVLQLQLNKAFDKMNVQIINSSGQKVKQLTVPASNQIINIPVQNLPAGKYWLHLQSADEKQVLQFVKQ